jgi:hypothetical protein
MLMRRSRPTSLANAEASAPSASIRWNWKHAGLNCHSRDLRKFHTKNCPTVSWAKKMQTPVLSSSDDRPPRLHYLPPRPRRRDAHRASSRREPVRGCSAGSPRTLTEACPGPRTAVLPLMNYSRLLAGGVSMCSSAGDWTASGGISGT